MSRKAESVLWMATAAPVNASLTLPRPSSFLARRRSYLAFRVANMGGMAQGLGKLGHEQATLARPRYWTLPWVGASMLGIALGARVLDRVLFDPEETLGFMVIARHRRGATS